MPMTRPSTPPVAILLAGGLGTRFDAAGRRNKLLAPLPGDPLNRPVALASAHALLAVLPRVIAVVRPDSAELENVLLQAGCEVVMSHATKRGMGATLAAGIQSCVDEAPPPGSNISTAGWLRWPTCRTSPPYDSRHCRRAHFARGHCRAELSGTARPSGRLRFRLHLPPGRPRRRYRRARVVD